MYQIYVEPEMYRTKKKALEVIKARPGMKQLSRDQWINTTTGVKYYVNGTNQIVHKY